jgi:hypothetical protein
VTVKLYSAGTARREALSDNVAVFVLSPVLTVIGFADHVAVRPEGIPVGEKPIDPANDPPVTAAKVIVAVPPCATAIEADRTDNSSVGGA